MNLIEKLVEQIEHLNLYGDFYLPEIGQRIAQSRQKAEADFQQGILRLNFSP
jgi:hypothetical protein